LDKKKKKALKISTFKNKNKISGRSCQGNRVHHGALLTLLSHQ
jgi:hypothetical protein